MFIKELIPGLIPLFANMQHASIFSDMDAKTYTWCIFCILMVWVQLPHYSGNLNFLSLGFKCPPLSINEGIFY